MNNFTLLALVISISLSFYSCDDGSELRTYQIDNKCSEPAKKTDKYLNGSLYEVEVHFFNNNDKVIEIHPYDKIAKGEKTGINEAPAGTVKAKISFRLLPKESSFYNIEENNRVYTGYNNLKKGKNTVIKIQDKTSVYNSLSYSIGDAILLESIFNKENLIFE